MQRLWFRCRPVGYRQHRLRLQLSQPQARLPPAAVSTDIDENGGVCFGALGAECEARSSDWRSQMQCSGSGFDAGRSAIASTDSDCSWANHRPDYRRCEHRYRRKRSCLLRCPSVLSARRDRVTGAARCNGAALVSMQAGRLSPVPTQTAAEPTTGPTTAAVSTDIDENARVCFGALRC